MYTSSLYLSIIYIMRTISEIQVGDKPVALFRLNIGKKFDLYFIKVFDLMTVRIIEEKMKNSN